MGRSGEWSGGAVSEAPRTVALPSAPATKWYLGARSHVPPTSRAHDASSTDTVERHICSRTAIAKSVDVTRSCEALRGNVWRCAAPWRNATLSVAVRRYSAIRGVPRGCTAMRGPV